MIEAAGKAWLLDLPLDRVHHASFPMEIVHGLSMIRGAGRVVSLRTLLDPRSWESDYYLRTPTRRRKLLRCLATWVDEQPARQPDLIGLTPGMTSSALREWAAARGVHGWLPVPMRDVLPALYSRDTIESAITGHREEVAWAAIDWLGARSSELGDALAEEDDLPTHSSDARHSELFDRLLAHRTTLRAVTRPGPRRGVGGPRFHPAADTLSVPTPLPLPGHPPDGVVTLALGDAAPRCGCGQPCSRALSALDAVIRWLGGPLPTALATSLATPAWRRRLSGLVPKGSAEVTWRLTLADDRLALAPGVLEGGLWSPRDVDPRDLRGADLTLATLRAALSHNTALTGPILGALVDHPRVVDTNSRRLAVRRPALGTRVTRDPGLTVIAVVDGRDAREFSWVALPGDVTVGLAEGALRVIDSTDPWWQAASLLEGGLSVPDAGEGELLDLLPALERLGDVAFDPSLRGEAQEPDPRPLLRLSADGETIRAEALVLPLLRGEPQPLGRGAEVVYAVGPAGTTHAVRRFEDEKAAWNAAALPLDGDGPWTITDPERAHALLTAIQSLGETIRVQWIGGPRRAISPTASDVSITIYRARDYLVLSGQLAIEGSTVPLDILFAALRGGKRFLTVNDQLIRLATPVLGEMARLARLADGDRLPTVLASEITALQAQGVAIVSPDWDALLAAAAAADQREVTVPTGLLAELRPYQREGVAFLLRMGWSPGALLCDDMGLGKTVQALGLLLARADLGPALVVAPTSLGFNWVRETERFAPSLQVRLHHGTGRQRALALGPGDVVVTTWDLLVRDADRFAGVRFATVVFDEAQAAKNPDTRRARAAREVDAAFRLVLSGTPIENRLSELWSLVSLAVPGLLGDRDTFRERFALPIERDADDEVRGQLARILSRFMLRRRKEDVARDLPPRTDVVVPIDLSAAEHRLYEHARQAALYLLAGVDMSVPQARFAVLTALTTLRQLACHPRLRHPDGPATSSKIEHLRELCAALKAGGHKVLVFSQFVQLLQLAKPVLAEEGLKLRYLDGSTSLAARRAEVDAFQAGDGDVFLISLKAGGTGLNLTAASYVVHLDPWWNPAVEAQASDRAHRIGQERPVTVYRLVARGTIEERIVALQDRKRELIRGILDAEAGVTPSLDELRSLLDPPS